MPSPLTQRYVTLRQVACPFFGVPTGPARLLIGSLAASAIGRSPCAKPSHLRTCGDRPCSGESYCPAPPSRRFFCSPGFPEWEVLGN
ncbi:predicted protein [Coccidioides posadasii str. Silveira]|uniref:Predicted protein n=1 Tax=Coccidioides posadasii (strain RMSCC 757 / Silveira) TaxID=443226 RepID=E9D7Z8_COCPS|nr:predicted protein [Coccidioides posadasii str. Silveira]